MFLNALTLYAGNLAVMRSVAVQGVDYQSNLMRNSFGGGKALIKTLKVLTMPYFPNLKTFYLDVD